MTTLVPPLTAYQERVRATIMRHPDMSVALISRMMNVPSKKTKSGMDFNMYVNSYPRESENKIQTAIDHLMLRRELIQTTSYPNRYRVKMTKFEQDEMAENREQYYTQYDPTRIAGVRGLDMLLAPSTVASQAEMRDVVSSHLVVV